MSQFRYFAKRIALMFPVLFLVMSFTFLIMRLGPLDPVAAMLGPQASGAQAADIRQRLGLNEPLWKQYLGFMGRLLTLSGQSWVVSSGTSARALIWSRFPRTLWLGLWSITLPIFVGVPLGFYAGLNSNSLGDYVASFLGIVWRAMPNFWLGIMLLAVLRQSDGNHFLFGKLPNWYTIGPNIESILGVPDLSFVSLSPIGFDFMTFLVAFKQIMPAAFVLGSALMVSELRIGRTATLEQVNANYVETAKAKGLRSRKIVWKHIFRNASIPMVPVMFSEIGILLGGSVIVETVFGINGIGALFIQAIRQTDVPLVGVLVFVFTIFALVLKIIEDFLYTVLDPRVGFEGQ